MNKNIRTRGIIIAAITFVCLAVLFGPWNKQKEYARSAGDFFKPAKLKQNLSENIRLGLDLKGGTHLVMQVQADEAIGFITENHRAKADEDLKKDGIKFTNVKVASPGLLVVETPDATEHTKIKGKLLAFMGSDGWEDSTTPTSISFKLKSRAADVIRKEATEQAKAVIERRINNFGVAEPTIQLHGREENHQILVQMPGVDDPERVKKLIGGESRLDIRAVSNPQKFDSLEQATAALGTDETKEILPNRESKADGTAETGYYIVDKTPVITGSDVRDARGQQNQQSFGFSVGFSLKPSGSEKFGTWTENNVGNYLAVVLNKIGRAHV